MPGKPDVTPPQNISSLGTPESSPTNSGVSEVSDLRPDMGVGKGNGGMPIKNDVTMPSGPTPAKK